MGLIGYKNGCGLCVACGGEIACSTCHVILDEKTYKSLPAPEEEEEDMLDLALGLTDTSRLGCQVVVTKVGFWGVWCADFEGEVYGFW